MSVLALHTGLRGMDLLDTPIFNKGTAFTDEERSEFGLHGLLPPHVESLEEQTSRAYEAYRRKTDDLERHIYLRALQDTNEVLFYSLLNAHIEEMTPMVYTPVVALGCQQFSRIYRRARGLFVPYPLRDSIPSLLRNRPNQDVDVIVVTDGERILGIGDQGVGGMGIPIGKLSLYSLIGGIHPARTLPVVLDVGTNNEDRLKAPEYLGWRHERITGDDYYDFVDLFVQAVKQELPHTCLQWEDFANRHARPLLERYRDELLTFNDDIQGTAAVVFGALTRAIRASGGSLKGQQIVFYGAGAAAIGVADYLRMALVDSGLTEEEAASRLWIVNRGGILHADRTDLSPEQRVYTQPVERLAEWRRPSSGIIDLETVIRNVNATILIGLSTRGGAFTESIVREMARKVDRPIIFPLSNPTDRCEALPEDLLRWTAGRAIVATGSPFGPVDFAGRKIPIAQCNNVYIFPAVGLGLVASKAWRVTDRMMIAAGRALGEHQPPQSEPTAALLPSLKDLPTIALQIAFEVGVEAQRAAVAEPTSPERLRARIAATHWTPEYPRLVTAQP
ncbi:MAG TPA: NAD-dependent malic enzyme [Methylomirabilota bacterium]|nr:NAD-dependent malic enzyme [Methylomirabilota bacterium]